MELSLGENFQEGKDMWNWFFGVIIKKENSEISRLRDKGKLLYLSELIPYFRGKNIFTFANGGSVANLKRVERLESYNLLSVHTGPLHFYREFGIMPNLWYYHWGHTANMILEEEKKTPLDFSETFILVPSSDSQSAVLFGSAVFRKFRRLHPEATYVLYREKRAFLCPENITETYMEEGVEPIYALGGGNVENSFLPICGFLGVKRLYFCGVDHLPTGHFWNRKLQYQTVRGEPLDFPDEQATLECSRYAIEKCRSRGMECFRLEKNETIMKSYPYINFDDALSKASYRIRPSDIKNRASSVVRL